jgi:hypothetical protein
MSAVLPRVRMVLNSVLSEMGIRDRLDTPFQLQEGAFFRQASGIAGK